MGVHIGLSGLYGLINNNLTGKTANSWQNLRFSVVGREKPHFQQFSNKVIKELAVLPL